MSVSRMMEIKAQAMAAYFVRTGGLYVCKRHGFPKEVDGGRCPSCSEYAMNRALVEAMGLLPDVGEGEE